MCAWVSRNDPPGVERQRTVVEIPQQLRPLEHAAVHQQPAMGVLKQEAGPGDGAGGAMEGEADTHPVRPRGRSKAWLRSWTGA
jgi:hypothetical protein